MNKLLAIIAARELTVTISSGGGAQKFHVRITSRPPFVPIDRLVSADEFDELARELELVSPTK